MKRMSVVVAVLVLAGLPSSAQGIDLQFEGPASEAAEVLGEALGIRVQIPGGEMAAREVVLDLQGATMRDALLELCAQIGAIYQWMGFQGDAVFLQPGDPSLDARPFADVGDYVVFVRGTTLSRTDALTMAWGRAEPERRSDDRLQVDLTIEPVTLEAARRLLGVQPEASALLDTDEALLTPEQGGPRAGAWQARMMGGRGSWGMLGFPPPETEATAIVELQGRLALWQSVEDLTVSFTPDEVGATKPLSYLDVTLESLGRLGDSGQAVCRVVGLDPSGQAPVEFSGWFVGPAGERSQIGNRSAVGDDEGYRLTMAASGITWDPVRLDLQVVLRHGPPELLDFTIEDIPLP